LFDAYDYYDYYDYCYCDYDDYDYLLPLNDLKICSFEKRTVQYRELFGWVGLIGARWSYLVDGTTQQRGGEGVMDNRMK